MFPDDSFFLLVLSHFKFVLRLYTHPGAFTLPVHAPNYWYSNVDRLIIQDILRTSLTYHWKKLDLPTVFTCWKVLHTSLFQSRPSPLGNTPSIWLEVCSIQWGIWPKMTPAQLAFWFYVKTCQRCRQKDFKILSTLSMCTVFMGHCSYIRCSVGAFDSLWKSPGFLKWTILLEWTNLCKTAFQDFRYFGCV